MPKQAEARPILSVITRRFPRERRNLVEASVERIQQAVAGQPGFLGLKNSLSEGKDDCELVTVLAFDSPENRRRWETSPVRERMVVELDRHSEGSAMHTHVGDLGLLLQSGSRVSRGETVAILIVWILILAAVLDWLADLALPDAFPAPLRGVLLIVINVLLISYVFLPWSGTMLSRLKARLSGKGRP